MAAAVGAEAAAAAVAAEEEAVAAASQHPAPLPGRLSFRNHNWTASIAQPSGPAAVSSVIAPPGSGFVGGGGINSFMPGSVYLLAMHAGRDVIAGPRSPLHINAQPHEISKIGSLLVANSVSSPPTRIKKEFARPFTL